MVRLEDIFKEVVGEEFNPEKKKKVGSYVLGRTLGEGSFAKVRLGVHLLTRERVAIKVISKRLIERREYVKKNMRREAAVLQRLDHPNIARLYEILETENSFYIIIELAEGGDMMKYLNDRNGIDEGEARRFMRQLVSAVDHMHRSGIIHRDLKVENLLLDKDSNLKIIDFGLSNFFDGINLLSTQCGSPAYAAPEIFNKRLYGPTVDIWSIGVNLFAMVTGKLPFTVDPPTNLVRLHALILRGCKMPSHISAGCRDLLSRMLEVNDKARISMKDVMTHPWLNEDYVPLEPWHMKTKISEDDMDQNVINYMVTSLGCEESEVKDAIMNHRPCAAVASYHLLQQRVERKLGYPDNPVEKADLMALRSDIALKDSNYTAFLNENKQKSHVAKAVVFLPRPDMSRGSSKLDPLSRETTSVDVQPQHIDIHENKENMECRDEAETPFTNYKECLNQLKSAKLRDNILKRQSSKVKVELDAVDKVAEVNRQELKSRVSQNRRRHKASAEMTNAKQNMVENVKQLKMTPNDLRRLSDKYLYKQLVDDRLHYHNQFTRKGSSNKDPSHKLRMMEMMQKYNHENTPPVPPNSADKRNQLDLITSSSSDKENVNDKDNDIPDSQLLNHHNCLPARPPIAHFTKVPVPDLYTDRFYDKYRFKVKKSDGRRMLTWDLRELELPRMGERSQTSIDMKPRRLGHVTDSSKPMPDIYAKVKVNLDKLGMSYSVPENNQNLSRISSRNTSRSMSSDSTVSSKDQANCAMDTTFRRASHVKPSDFLYADFKPGRFNTFVMNETNAAAQRLPTT